MVVNSPLGPGKDLAKCGTCQKLQHVETMKVVNGRYRCQDCQTCKPYRETDALGRQVERNPCQ